MTILCFWGIQHKIYKDGIHKPYAGREGHKAIKRGKNMMKLVIVDEEVYTQNSVGRSYSGSRRIRGKIFR